MWTPIQLYSGYACRVSKESVTIAPPEAIRGTACRATVASDMQLISYDFRMSSVAVVWNSAPRHVFGFA